ncbi:hypothetical protein Lpar_1962 [Legionella parisiensis]|uniref:Uncharacterized protein n=1 Tax=Legionella parisiensis TaxID=45071 RepID=A0A1E5JPZ3_9GAMM|nr:hypothetical protein Lpar_1962 [Legionella parisiensis]OEH46108.1 hypothetical protein lpari_02911 [Legionella parisiensis]STX76962.1 Uncharacterised protein [Legionella parisiensis]
MIFFKVVRVFFRIVKVRLFIDSKSDGLRLIFLAIVDGNIGVDGGDVHFINCVAC